MVHKIYERWWFTLINITSSNADATHNLDNFVWRMVKHPRLDWWMCLQCLTTGWNKSWLRFYWSAWVTSEWRHWRLGWCKEVLQPYNEHKPVVKCRAGFSSLSCYFYQSLNLKSVISSVFNFNNYFLLNQVSCTAYRDYVVVCDRGWKFQFLVQLEL